MIKCLVLVEGPYDELRLSLLKNLFDSSKIEILSLGCDKLGEKDYCVNFKDDISHLLDKEKKYSIDDFDYIIEVCDLDGCFIEDDLVIENTNIKKVEYYDSHIEAVDKTSIIQRNHIKANNINGLLNNHILLYYNSTNIDHAFNDLQNPSKKEKRNLAISMYDKYKDDDKAFLELLYNANKLKSKNYEESWNDVKKDIKSLTSNSNIIFFIDRFQNELKEELKYAYCELKSNKF